MDLSLKKKVLFYTILFILLYVVTEFMSYGVFRIKYGNFSFGSLQSEREVIALSARQQGRSPNRPKKNRHNWNVLHPYLGFVTEGIDLSRACSGNEDCDQRTRTYEDAPFEKAQEDEVYVAVLGGSFAHGTSYGSTPGLLENELRKIAKYKDKTIKIYHLAVGGYKQPQQLMKLNYLLTLGADFDVVINIDGFNEIALPIVENIPKGVHPIFPRSWYYYVDGSLNPDLLALYGTKEFFKKKQIYWAQLFASSLIRYSVTANLVWKKINAGLVNKIKNAEVLLVEYKEGGIRRRQYVATGPDYNLVSAEDQFQEMAEVWSRSSLQIFYLCKAQGIEYFHFLQPNQYVEGSKKMSPKELKIAVTTNSRYGKAAASGYPFLLREGQKLKEKGVPYFDLTMMFSANAGQLYIDDCCHLNTAGYNLVVKEIGRRIKSYLDSE